MNLCDMRELKDYNDNVTFLLTIIDVFSKMAFVRPLNDKSGPTVLVAFYDILSESGRTPSNLHSDLFSKMAFVRPLNDKSGPTVLVAFYDILSESGRTPSNLHSDLGTEFTNKKFKHAMNKKNINYFAMFSENKAAVIKRFNRTLKTRMWKYFTHANTLRYVDVLQSLVEGYNSTPHRGIKGRIPNSVTEHNLSTHKIQV